MSDIQSDSNSPQIVPFAAEQVDGFNSPGLAEKFSRLGLDKWSVYLDKITQDFRTAEKLLQKAGVCLETSTFFRRQDLPEGFRPCDFLQHSSQCDCVFGDELQDFQVDAFETMKAGVRGFEQVDWLSWKKIDGKFRIVAVTNRRVTYFDGVSPTAQQRNWYWDSKPILECGVEEKVAAFPKLSELLDKIHSMIAPAVQEIERPSTQSQASADWEPIQNALKQKLEQLKQKTNSAERVRELREPK